MLQQENAAPFDGVEEGKHNMPEELLPYEHVAQESKPEKADYWNNIHNPEDTNNHLDAMEDEEDMTPNEFSLETELRQSAKKTPNKWKNAKVKITELYNTKTSKQEKVSMEVSRVSCAIHIKNINTKQYSSDFMVGGKGGTTVNINVNGEANGRVVRSLKFWQNDGFLSRLETELSDGSKFSCGHAKQKASETFHLMPDEKFRYLHIYSEKHNCTGLATGVSFATNKGRYFEFLGEKSKYYYRPQRMGSGILVGFKTHCGHLIDALMFLFLQKVESSTLSNVHYPNINSLSVIERPVHINGMRCNNKGRKTEQDFTFSGTRSVHETHQWSFGSAGLETQLTDTRVKASTASINMPTGTSLVSGPVTSNPYTHGRKLSFNSTQHYAFNIKVPPGKQVIATATAYQGIIATPYTGTLTVKLTTGRKFSYSVTGVYRSRTTSNVVVTTKDTA